jgi:3,4-dihydroxy 2-butanone 4-phosphate synthase/GTP cyclohydrolase II
MTGFASVPDAVAALREGRPVLVLDDAGRENEGDVVLAAELATPEWLAWTIRHTSGYLCAPLPAELADALALPLMVADSADPLRTAYTVSVDAAAGITTGISAADRTRTLHALAAPGARASDLIRPGHVLPLRARPGGVLERAGHTEAAVDLCRIAGLRPIGAIAELVHDDGTMMRTEAVLAMGAAAGLPVLTIADLVAWRQRHDRVVEEARTWLPTRHGRFELIGYRDLRTGDEHVLLVSPLGLGSEGEPPLVRLHSECLTGDGFGSLRCDCGPQLEMSLELLGRSPGALVYLRGHEGRGVGLLAKLRAYALQDAGRDTVDAQLDLGLPIDDREYGAGAAILAACGLRRVRLLSNNPDKAAGLAANGIEVVSIEPLRVPPSPSSRRYLQTKADRLGHLLTDHAKGA